jgi:hypothetical protein
MIGYLIWVVIQTGLLILGIGFISGSCILKLESEEQSSKYFWIGCFAILGFIVLMQTQISGLELRMEVIDD